MKKSKIYSSADFKGASEQECRKVAEICREFGISEQTFYNWKSKYGGMTLSELQRVKELESENAASSASWQISRFRLTFLRRLTQKSGTTLPKKERCIAYILELNPDISYAKVCRIIGRSRTSKYYKKRMPQKDES